MALLNAVRRTVYRLKDRFFAAADFKDVADPPSRAFHFLWLNLDLPALPDPADGSLRAPLPPKYIENVRRAGASNPETDVMLWVDSKRLTERQFAFLKTALETDRPNVHLMDLRGISAYDREPLYNQGETDPHWRNSGQNALIWRQVDAAKVLVSLQGDYDQVFFSDLDHAHMGISNRSIQDVIRKNGLMIGSSGKFGISIENQLWGFNRRRREFFTQYCADALKAANEGQNAWRALVTKVEKDLQKKEGLELEDFCLRVPDDWSRAEQPGHAWRSGKGGAEAPAVIPGAAKASP
jgi:hypothetical protein